MSTYLSLYTAALEARIAAGGPPETVDAAFAEYNTFDAHAFATWAKQLPALPCIGCGAPFAPEPRRPDAETLCPTCEAL